MAQVQRWNRTMLRVRPRLAQLGITRQGLCTVSRSSLMLKKRICSNLSVPAYANRLLCRAARSGWIQPTGVLRRRG